MRNNESDQLLCYFKRANTYAKNNTFANLLNEKHIIMIIIILFFKKKNFFLQKFSKFVFLWFVLYNIINGQKN